MNISLLCSRTHNWTRRSIAICAVVCATIAVGKVAIRAASAQELRSQKFAVSRSGGRASRLQTQRTGFAMSRLEAQSLYIFTFGELDYPRAQVGGFWGINDSGKIVGGYNNMNLEIYSADHGSVLKKNRFATLDYPGAGQTELFAINKTGEIVGAFGNSTTDCCHGFKRVGSTYTQLDCPGSDFTVALGVNNSGDIVGMCADPNTGQAKGYLLSGSTYTIIAVPEATYTYTEGINNAGIIAGYYFDNAGNSHGFTWDKGTITTIDYGNGYPNTYLAGINDKGVIVGGYGSNVTIDSIAYPWEHGFLYSNGVFSTFDAPFGDVQITQPWGMNNKGEIVGGYVDSQGMLYGFYLKVQ